MARHRSVQTARAAGVGRIVGAIRRDRAALLRSTALQAAVLSVVALPQAQALSPNAHPVGGQVVAGSASIGQSATSTVINQSSGRAGISWQGFDVGSQQSVIFNQPNSSSVTLNRVTSPDASQIAGHIRANGQVVLMNQSGVVFLPGSTVDAQSVVVSAASMSNGAMAAAVASTSGKMAFDLAAKPGALVSNAGTITVKQSGLAALVAPRVANSGVIAAKLGHVVLAGAQTATLDLYGDGLLSIDVTQQVTKAGLGTAPGDKTPPALVTNTGTIIADGGTVLLTAAAADGVVQTLVTSSGRIQANSVGAATGRIVLHGTGGDVVVDGTVQAAGLAAGTRGGQIEVNGTGTVMLRAGARVDASGAAGGGLVAIGTTLARAAGGAGVKPALTAKRTVIAQRATVAADATRNGAGGRITVLSTDQTDVAGSIFARGTGTGAGGFVELSGSTMLSLTGTADVSAPAGPGSILIDPLDLYISAAVPQIPGAVVTPIAPLPTSPQVPAQGFAAFSWITPKALQGLKGNIDLQATGNIEVASSVALAPNGGQSLTLEAGNSITVDAVNPWRPTTGVNSITAPGGITLMAANAAFAGLPGSGFSAAGSITVNGSLITSLGAIHLSAGTGGITLAGTLAAPNQVVSLATPGAITQTAGRIVSDSVTGGAVTSSGVSLNSRANAVDKLNTFTTAGNFSLVNSIPLTVIGTVQAGSGAANFASTLNLTNTGGDVTIGTATAAGFLRANAISVSAGTFANVGSAAGSGPVRPAAPGVLTVGNINVVNGGIIAAPATLFGDTGPTTIPGSINLTATGRIRQTGGSIDTGAGGTLTANATSTLTQAGGTITAGTLTGTAAAVVLGQPNLIDNLGAFTTTVGEFFLREAPLHNLNVSGLVSVPGGQSITLDTDLLTADGFGVGLQAPGGTVTLAPVTPGRKVELIASGTPDPNALSIPYGLNTSFSSLIGGSSGATLVLGSPTSGAVKIGNPGDIIDMTTGFGSTAGGSGFFALDILSSGAVTEGAAALNVATLEGQAASADFGGPAKKNANKIGTLGNFRTQGNFNLYDSQSLLVAGNVSAGTIAAPNVANTATLGLGVAGDLTLGAAPGVTIGTIGTLNAGTVALVASGAITEANGYIGANLLTGPSAATAGTAATATSVALDSGLNRITTLGDFASSGDLTLTDGTSLTVAGNAQAGVGAFTTPLSNLGLTVNGTLTIAGTGQVSGGNVALSGSTGIGISGRIAAIPLADGNVVTVPGSITLTSGATVTQFAGLVDTGTGGTLSVNAKGAFQQRGGTIHAGFLNGQAASAALNRPNVIGDLQNFTTTLGSFSLTEAPLTNLNVSGLVTVPNAQNISIGTDLLTAGRFGAVGLDAPGGTVAIVPVTYGRKIELVASGAPTPNTLSIPYAANGFSSLIGGSTGKTLQIGSAAAGDIAIGNSGDFIDLSAGFGSVPGGGFQVLDLVSHGAVTENATARLKVPTLEGDTASATLGSVAAPIANQITNLGAFTTSGNFSLTNGQTMNVTGPVSSGPAALAANTATLSLDVLAGNLVIGPAGAAGSLRAGSVAVRAAGQIAEPAGFIAANTLAGSATSALLGGNNAVASLGAFTALGGFTLNDVQALQVTGLLNAGNAGVALTIAGALTEPGGAIDAGTLGGTATSATLGGANVVATLGNFTAHGGFALNDTRALRIAGTLDGGASTVSLTTAGTLNEVGQGRIIAGTLTGYGTQIILAGTNMVSAISNFNSTGGFVLRDDASLDIMGFLNSGSAALDLFINGALTETGGTITSSLLTGVAQAVTLNNTNTIATVGGFNAPGGFSLNDNRPLVITGLLDAHTGAASLTVGGTLTEQGNGAIIAGLLSGSATQATLDGTNAITALGGFTAPGGFALNSTGPLAIVGALDAGTAAVTLTTGGALTETGGTITAGSLSGSASAVSLGGGNAIGALGGFTALGGFALTDTQALTLTGALDGGTGIVTLTTSGALTQTPSSTISAGTLTGAASSASLLGANSVPTLGGFAAPGGFAFNDIQGLSIGGTLDTGAAGAALTLGGMLTEQGGIVTAGRLSGSATAVALNAANQIGTLGGFSTGTGSFALVDAQALTIAGPLTAGSLSITAAGQMALAGDLDLTGGAGGGSVLAVTPATLGGAANFVQNGSVTVAGSGTLTISLLSQGVTNFTDLTASGVNLVLALGAGQATGGIAVGGLLVQGQAGSATLVGSIAGTGGRPAAALGQITPTVNAAYTLNGCVIAAATCGVNTATQPVQTGTQVTRLGGQVTTTTNGGITTTTTTLGTSDESVLGGLSRSLSGVPGAPALLPSLAIVVAPSPPAPAGRLTDQDVVPFNVSPLDF